MTTSSRRIEAPGSPLRVAAAGAWQRWAGEAHLPLAALLTAALGFQAGGYFPTATGLAAVVGACALLLRVTLTAEPFAGWSRAAAISALAAAGFASWVMLSASWSGAPARALVEFDRALLYLELLALYASAPRRDGMLSALLGWVLAAFVAICVGGLASRLAPDLAPTSGRFVAERLAFPLTYWNAMGMASALTVVLALHQAAAARSRLARLAGAAAVPVGAVTLYLTFSRGGIAACALGLLAYLVITRTFAAVVALAAAGLPAAVAVLFAYRADALGTEHYAQGVGVSQGHRVALVVALAVLAAVALRALAERIPPLPAGAPARFGPRTRGERVGLAGALGLALIALLLWVHVPARIDHAFASFRSGDLVPDTGNARDRLVQVGNNGRLDFWQVSLDTWAGHPLIGTGAGTYQLEWERRRPYFYVIHDGHSLYLETLGELGVVGLALLLVALLTPLALALRRGLARRGPGRAAHGAMAAAGLALLAHAGMDWDWEMPVLFVWYFAAAGVVVAAPAGAESAIVPPRLGRVVAGLACLLLAITPWLVAGSQRALDAATSAFHDGDCRTAVADALTARNRLSVRAEPYEILGYCDLRAGEYGLALTAMRAATKRDPNNWRYAYGLAVAQAIDGRDPRPAAAEAVRLNPREPLARQLARGLATNSRARRFRAAARARIPGGG